MPTDRNSPFIVLTQDAAARIAAAPIEVGELKLRFVSGATLYVVDSIEVERGLFLPADIPVEYKTLKWGGTRHQGQWMRKPLPDLHILHLETIRRPGTRLDYPAFRESLPGVRTQSATATGLLITHDPDLDPAVRAVGGAEFAGWIIRRDGVTPIQVAVEPATVGFEQLRDLWPVDLLAATNVMLVGCGSIGGAAADALAGFGIGRVQLVDPDRFLWHNIVRHVLGPDSVGRYKVDALKAHLDERWPHRDVEAHRLDIVEDAHHIRALIDDVDIVLCAADGVAPRRVTSHLARRAVKPAVLACVLDRGAIGEIVRLRPTPRFGCLLCLRDHMAQRGALDAEADQELDYGTGHVHQPMTAIPTDLHHIGVLAAKITVATILESRHGDATQRLPGEHAIIGLRPGNDLAPPFGLANAGQIRWDTIPAPRPACATCNPDTTPTPA